MDNDRVVVYCGAEPFRGCLSDPDQVRAATAAPGYGPPLRDTALDRARSSRDLGAALHEVRQRVSEAARQRDDATPEGGSSAAGGARVHGGYGIADLATGLLNSSRLALGGLSARPDRSGAESRPSDSLPLLAQASGQEGGGSDAGASRHLSPSQQHVTIRVPQQPPSRAAEQRGATAAGGVAAAMHSGPGGRAAAAFGAATPKQLRQPGTSPSGKHFVPAHVAALARVVDRVRMMNRVKGRMVVREGTGGEGGRSIVRDTGRGNLATPHTTLPPLPFRAALQVRRRLVRGFGSRGRLWQWPRHGDDEEPGQRLGQLVVIHARGRRGPRGQQVVVAVGAPWRRPARLARAPPPLRRQDDGQVHPRPERHVPVCRDSQDRAHALQGSRSPFRSAPAAASLPSAARQGRRPRAVAPRPPGRLLAHGVGRPHPRPRHLRRPRRPRAPRLRARRE